MQFEFDLNQQLNAQSRQQEMKLEDRKDTREEKKTSKKFESSGNDILGGGIGLDKFNPQIGN